MTVVIRFTKIRFYTIGLSVVLLLAGFAVTYMNGGFNLGIGFQSGLNERIQIAPVAFTINYTGKGDARLDSISGGLSLEIRSEEGVKYHTFMYQQYPTLSWLKSGLSEVPGIDVTLVKEGSASSSLISTGIDFPLSLGTSPNVINIQNTDESSYVTIDRVRSALSDMESPQIQVLGKEHRQGFLSVCRQMMTADRQF